MSAPLINRSLTTIRTELEFLRDSEVITEELYEKLNSSLPAKYSKDMTAWGVDKLGSVSTNEKASYSTDKLADQLSTSSISAPPGRPPQPPAYNAPVAFCRALFDYNATESEDLGLKKDDQIVVLEKLSPDWWKGHLKNQSTTGVFPSNYVVEISEKEFESHGRAAAAPPPEKAQYLPPQQGYSPQPPHQPPLQQQASYGGYSQFPPPSTNYYPPPQQLQQAPPQQFQQEPQQQPPKSHDHLKKFGSKLGNAAIFGAGATIGSDIVNSIF
ncbi:SH3 domain-containing protein [Scheffersomyces xylosifermentans]|uniref:SH3 domain-containing protein n=1 Tax=Scheffersomyces xylosifermentans TaxID=1304137 RepID=UPI00315C8E33